MRLDEAVASGENSLQSYFITRHTPSITTASNPHPSPNPFSPSYPFAHRSNGISQLLGTPAMPTKWSVKGYNASSMLYADTEDIPNAIKGFTEKAGEEGVEVRL